MLLRTVTYYQPAATDSNKHWFSYGVASIFYYMPVTSSTTLMLTLVANQLLWQPFTYTGHYSYSVTTLQGCLTCAPIYGITGTGSVLDVVIGVCTGDNRYGLV